MKRPLFLAMVSFALGEVAMITATGACFPVMMTAGLVFVLLCISKRGRNYRILPLFLLLGICYMRTVWGSYGTIDSYMKEPDEEAISVCGDLWEAEGTIGKSAEPLPVRVKGRIVEKTSYESGNTYVIRVTWTEIPVADGAVETADRYRVTCFCDEDFSVGDGVAGEGKLVLPKAAGTPGTFDRRRYLKSRGIPYELAQPKLLGCPGKMPHELPTDPAAGRVMRFLSGVRERAARNLSQLTDADTAALLAGILLGDKKGIDHDVKDLYRVSGIAHILAISSLHITLIAGFLLWIMIRLGIPVFYASGVSLFFVFVYAFMTGMGPATLRALIMLVIVTVGRIAGRHYDMLTSLSVALFIMFLINPYRIYDGGVLLSFAAVFGVCLGRRLAAGFGRRKICEKMSFIIGLQLVLTPMILYVYYEIPLYGVLVNIPVVALLAPIVVSGFAGLLTSFFFPTLGMIFLLPARYLLAFCDALCRTSLRLPANRIVSGHFSVSVLLVWYGLLFFFLRLLFAVKGKRGRVIAAFLATGISFWLLFSLMQSAGKREMILVADVGQGDGIFVRAEGGGCFMIDGGSSSEKSVGTYVIEPALKYRGVTEIDAWFVTHTDKDHVRGLMEILAEGKLSGLRVRCIVLPAYGVSDAHTEELLSCARRAGVPVVYMKPQDVIASGRSTFTCLGPGPDTDGDKNERSLLLWYRSGDFDAVFTGDAGRDALEESFGDGVLTEIPSASVEFLKVPHHGSKYSVSPALYASLSSSSVAAISCGEKNSYGHPHPETMDALSKGPATVLRTDFAGGLAILVKE